MTVPVFDDLDLQLNQLLDAVLQLLSADPGSPTQGQIWFNTTTAKIKYFDGTSTRTLNGATKFAQSVGDGTHTSFTVNHALNTTDVIVQVYQTASPFSQIVTTIDIVDVNNVSVSFKRAPTTNQFRVVVVG